MKLKPTIPSIAGYLAKPEAYHRGLENYRYQVHNGKGSFIRRNRSPGDELSKL